MKVITSKLIPPTDADNMSNWMWRSLGQEFGPVETIALCDLAKNGTLGPDDEV